MIIAKIQVNGAIAETVYRKVIPAGIIGAQVEFDYAEDIWHGLHKTVVFKGAVTKDVVTDGILEINFIGGIYPSGTLTRFGQSLNGDNDISDGEFTDGTTITGLYLDNITGFNAFLSSAKGTVNVVWEGTLNASVNISTANALTAESVNRLISCLADCSASDAQTLTLGTNLLARVTDESKEIATARNWTLA